MKAHLLALVAASVLIVATSMHPSSLGPSQVSWEHAPHNAEPEEQANLLQDKLTSYKQQVMQATAPKPANAVLIELAGEPAPSQHNPPAPTSDSDTAGDSFIPLTRKPKDALSNPFERYGASSVVRNDVLYVFGGMVRGGALPSNDLLQFDLNSRQWSTVPVYGQKPIGRFFHSATLSSDGNKMYITGGTPCFSRIFMKSLDFEDSNGQYVVQRQHAITEALSVEHSTGLDDVAEFDFATKEWKQIKPPTDDHMVWCKAATNVFYDSAASSASSPALLYPALLMVVTAVLAGPVGF